MIRQIPKVWRAKSFGLGKKTRVEQLSREVDFDTSSRFEWTTTDLTPYNQIIVDFTLANPGTDLTPVTLRVAGADSGYDYSLRTPTRTVQHIDNDAFRVTVLPAYGHHIGRVMVSSHNPLAPAQPTVTADVAGYPEEGRLDAGRLNQAVDHVDSISLQSDKPVAGKAIVLGKLV